MQKFKKISKVLLIYPPTPIPFGGTKMCVPPLGISYIASAIRDDVEVKLLDASIEGLGHEEKVNEKFFRFGLSIDEIKKRIVEYQCDMVGISCLFSPQFPVVAEIARMVKTIDSSIVTTVGGAHPTFLPEECLSRGNIDFIVSGEGEYTFREFIIAINQGKDIASVQGLVYRENGNLKSTPTRPLIHNLDELPLPARDLLPMKKYFKAIPFGIIAKKGANTSVMTSRGCTARCIFCSSHKYWRNTYRVRSPENVLDEIGYLIKKYNIKQLQFIDDNLTHDRKRAKEIFRGMIERKFNLQWNTPNGVALWTLDEETIELMKQSGCYELVLPYESGDPKVLRKIIKKPFNLEFAKKMTKAVKKAGIRTYAYTVVGFPGETKQQMQNTYNFVKALDVDSAVFFIANPLPGSELYEVCKKQGYLTKDFSFDYVGWSMAQVQTPDFTASEVNKMVARWNLLFNLSLIKRHPLKFIMRYGRFLFTQPRQLKETIFRRLLRNI